MRTGLDSRLCGNDEFQDYGVVGRVSRLRCCRNATEPSFPRKWESRISGFQSFPIDSRRVGGLDSRLCGNDEFQDYGVVGRVSRLRCCRNATEPSFPRKWESRISGFQSFPIDSRRVGGLDSRLCGNDEFQDYGVVGRVSRLRCCRNATEPSFPRKWESRISGFQSFPIDSRRVRGLDSRLRGNDEFRDYGVVGNDESIHTETCTTSFPRKWESRISRFQSFPIDSRRVRGLDSRLRGNDESIHTETCTTSFPRKWESRISGVQSFPIDSRRVGESGFPPVRE